MGELGGRKGRGWGHSIERSRLSYHNWDLDGRWECGWTGLIAVLLSRLLGVGAETPEKERGGRFKPTGMGRVRRTCWYHCKQRRKRGTVAFCWRTVGSKEVRPKPER